MFDCSKSVSKNDQRAFVAVLQVRFPGLRRQNNGKYLKSLLKKSGKKVKKAKSHQMRSKKSYYSNKSDAEMIIIFMTGMTFLTLMARSFTD
jgi:hypothetical protein